LRSALCGIDKSKALRLFQGRYPITAKRRTFFNELRNTKTLDVILPGRRRNRRLTAPNRRCLHRRVAVNDDLRVRAVELRPKRWASDSRSRVRIPFALMVMHQKRTAQPYTGLPDKNRARGLVQALFGRNYRSLSIHRCPRESRDCFGLRGDFSIALNIWCLIFCRSGYLGRMAPAWRIPETQRASRHPRKFENRIPSISNYRRNSGNTCTARARPGTQALETVDRPPSKSRMSPATSTPNRSTTKSMVRIRATKVEAVAQRFIWPRGRRSGWAT